MYNPLELLSESFQNEIDELQSLLENSDNALLKAKKAAFQKQLGTIISNLESYNDSLYSIFENSGNTDTMKENYEVCLDVLREKLTYDEKLDLRLTHKIDLWDY